MADDEIWIIPFFGKGHLFPLMELCKHLASRDLKPVYVISSTLSSSVPTSLRHHPRVEIVEVSETPPPPPPPPEPLHRHHAYNSLMEIGLEKLLSARTVRPLCAILDMKMSWTHRIFNRFEIPAVSLFTSAASSAAIEYAMWKAPQPLDDIKYGETRLLSGLPEEMAVTVSDLKRRSHGPSPLNNSPRGQPISRFGAEGHHPLKAGDEPPWLEETEPCTAVMINTCDDLERPFIDYLADKLGKPVWAVGPLLPQEYWKPAGSVLHDREVRTDQISNMTEDKVNEWLDSKPRGSVLYISFGSTLCPTKEESQALAEALDSSTRPFIWVLQTSTKNPSGKPQSKEDYYFPHELNSRVGGGRGLIIHGWAPQLLILSHRSTGGFLSHCGWNSTVEAIGRGVPFLAWPIRGDQYNNAKFVVSYLKVGYLISEDMSRTIKKDEITRGIEKLLDDEDMKQRAAILRAKFEHGFPKSSVVALDAFANFIRQSKYE